MSAGTASSAALRQLVVALATALALVGCAKKHPRVTAKARGVYEQLATRLEQAARKQDAKEVHQACAGSAIQSCSCLRTAAKLALDRDFHKEALLVLDAKPAGCRVGGLMAEALARARRLDEAEREAQAALKENPQDRYATYAAAHVLYVRGKAGPARAEAQRAVQRGRGCAAHLLVGLLDFHGNRLQDALNSFERMRKLDSRDVAAIYNIAVVYHRQNRYRLAREEYLRALRINPRHADSRYNLVILTHGVGAQAEARHHLKKYAFLLPQDPRIPKLTALLKETPRRRPMGQTGPMRPGMTP